MFEGCELCHHAQLRTGVPYIASNGLGRMYPPTSRKDGWPVPLLCHGNSRLACKPILGKTTNNKLWMASCPRSLTLPRTIFDVIMRNHFPHLRRNLWNHAYLLGWEYCADRQSIGRSPKHTIDCKNKKDELADVGSMPCQNSRSGHIHQVHNLA